MRTSIGKPNKADRARFDAFQRIGCIACRQRKRFSVPEVHHLLSGNKRRGHRYTIPLCPAHHRGVYHSEELHGPSLAKSPKAFRAEFGGDETLLSMTNMILIMEGVL